MSPRMDRRGTRRRVGANDARAMSPLPRVFLDLALGRKPIGRVTIELRADVVPKTCEISERCARANADEARARGRR